MTRLAQPGRRVGGFRQIARIGISGFRGIPTYRKIELIGRVATGVAFDQGDAVRWM